MKRNIIYMVGALLSSAILTFSCSDDNVPSYSNMSVDKNELFIKIENHTAEVNITEGNGNYKIQVANEDIVTAQINGDKITFTALKNGRTTATITDWAKHSAVINIRVKEDFELELAKSKITLFKNTKEKNSELISINSGNDGYKIKSNDNEDAVEAIITEDNKVKVTSLGKGIANIIVIDDDGKEFPLKVTSCENELKLGDIPSLWKAGTDKTINIVTGNGGYEISSDNEDIAIAEVIEDTENPENCYIKITGKTGGETIITVTDEMGLSVPVKVKVKNLMSVETLNIDELIIGGETKDIVIKDGSGMFECSGKNVEGTISEDGTKVTLKGTTRAGYTQDSKLTLKDKEFGETVEIKINKVDVPFLETRTVRYNVGGWMGELTESRIGKSGDKDKITISNKKYFFLQGDKLIDGYNIYFSGGTEPGPKTDAVMKHINDKGDQEDPDPIPIENLEIVDVQEGWYWLKFHETGKDYGDSYIVVHP